MSLSFYQTKTHKVILRGTSSFHKFIYKNSAKLLRLPRVHCIDNWMEYDKIYVIRIKFKKFGQ